MGFNYFMVQGNIAVAIPISVSLCLLYMWQNDIAVVSLHWYYNTCSAWFLDIRVYQLVYSQAAFILGYNFLLKGGRHENFHI